MRPGASRADIIRTTQHLIARNGIRAVRVDEIAQALGISKRTLYEMFFDKTGLISACLDEISSQQRRRIDELCAQHEESALEKASQFLHSHIDNLYRLGVEFLFEIRDKADFSHQFNQHREFYCMRLAHILGQCLQEGLLLDSITPQLLAKRLLETLLALRLSGIPCDELHLFCRMILRGSATRQGIELLDRE